MISLLAFVAYLLCGYLTLYIGSRVCPNMRSYGQDDILFNLALWPFLVVIGATWLIFSKIPSILIKK